MEEIMAYAPIVAAALYPVLEFAIGRNKDWESNSVIELALRLLGFMSGKK